MTAIPPLLQFASSFQVSQQGGMTAGEEASSKARFLRVYFRRSMPHTTAAIPDPRRAKPKTPPFPQPRTREPSDRIRGILSWDFWRDCGKPARQTSRGVISGPAGDLPAGPRLDGSRPAASNPARSKLLRSRPGDVTVRAICTEQDGITSFVTDPGHGNIRSRFM